MAYRECLSLAQQDQEAVARKQHEKWEHANAIRAAEKAWEEERQRNHQALMDKVHSRGSAGFHNQRLKALEDGYDEAERQEHAADRRAYLARKEEKFAENLSKKTANATRMRNMVEDAHAKANEKLTTLKRSQSNSTMQVGRARIRRSWACA